MKRRFIATLFGLITLLTSCGRNNLRSDIKNFIASFSIELAKENYIEGSYERVDISEENGGVSKIVTVMKMSRKNEDNLVYDYSQKTYENEIEKKSSRKYVERREDKYFLISDEGETEKNTIDVLSLTLDYFYTSSTEGIYTGGMFMGDAFREILPDIQDNVSIDEENKLLVYSYVNHMVEDSNEVTITQTVTLDQWGMLVKDDLVKQSQLGKFETHIVTSKAI